ncbi:cation diffusion facilitator CzcD-associated flavoprotein CzcO [Kribbella steppae]|uniref:Cation diffusion facilitator CzcD-associated flavoprotein CzcO n=1 Tax=Kribbella steppae TaxID=2512223 RepID=A0A4V2S181_9ACTN|nr:NAD(P)/FAD-dependent oxidoreductase [Kribbella steppae]TCO35530.1 cation diffusion facilitator CzcD-associated flavoprotein CzcO [Kribbella steppae]
MDVVVVGAGASGIGAAIRLLQAGITDFTVLEKSSELGGTWRDNTYPGCACDVPSALYSYSFAPNPSWTRAFAGQSEIRSYLSDTAARYGVTPYIRCGVEMLRAQWDGAAQRWLLETSDGPLEARVLITATGPWHQPLIPSIPGAFDGPVFHSSRWDHSIDLSGLRVAVVGSGASAVQFVPAIQELVSSLHLFQRTAQWVLPKPDHHVPGVERWVFRRFPMVQRLLRRLEYLGMEALGLGFRHPWIMRAVQQVGLLHLRRSVQSASLRAALTPSYTLGCKRLLMSNTYYPALAQSNVSVHPTAVASFDGRRVIGADGTEALVDVVILGTGFRILDLPVATKVYGADGRSLADHWQGSPRANLGTAVAGFPNLFNLLGPNLGTGHTSAFMILEAQLDHVLGAVSSLLDHGWSSLDVRPEVQASFVAEVQEALRGTVYETGGCASYYHDVNGRNSFSWPWSSGRLRTRVAHFDASAYTISAPLEVVR